MKILVTGGAGFIGSNFIRWMLGRTGDLRVVNLDKLTYAGNRASLRDLERDSRHRFCQGDVADPEAVEACMKGCEAVVHFAAETHVDRSIVKADDFLRTNVLGTHVLLEAARRLGIGRYLQISTDEVYGSLQEGAADEESPLRPNSPYAASKAGADHLVRSYGVTFGLPVVVLRASNNFGPYQFPEKFLPVVITRAMDGEPVPVYGDGRYVREWLFVEDFCEAIEMVLEKGQPGRIYNVGSGEHRMNLDLVREVLRVMGRPEGLIRHVEDRPGHDRRYAVVSEKVRVLGWAPRHRLEGALEQTVAWYRDHESWWRPLKEKSRIAV